MSRETARPRVFQRILILLLVMTLSACVPTGAPAPTVQAALSTATAPAIREAVPSPTTEVSIAPLDEETDVTVFPECWIPAGAQAFWGTDQGDEDDVRYTLAAETLDAYLVDMAISSICVPTQLGALYLNVDWNSADLGHVTGRMLSLGFTELYAGSGWGDGYLVYATYDFAAGTEYDVFARPEDWEAAVRGTLQGVDPIEVDSMRGFIRFQRGLCYGSCRVFRVILLPFEAHYIAIVQTLGEYDGDVDWEELVVQLREGDFPPTWQGPMAAMDVLTQSLRFTR
jgi:hypothetical protein